MLRPVLVAYLDHGIRKMFSEVLCLDGHRVVTTDSAAQAYKHLWTSPEPLLALIGPWLVGGTSLDLLRAVAEDPALQRHRYISLAFGGFRDEAQQREWEALSERLLAGHLSLPCTVDQMLNLLEAVAATLPGAS